MINQFILCPKIHIILFLVKCHEDHQFSSILSVNFFEMIIKR